jgi:hypothetical protein
VFWTVPSKANGFAPVLLPLKGFDLDVMAARIDLRLTVIAPKPRVYGHVYEDALASAGDCYWAGYPPPTGALIAARQPHGRPLNARCR